MPLLHVTLVPAPDRVVVRLTGDADLSTAALLTEALARAAALGTRHVVVDVAGVRFWDCSGLHALHAVTIELDAADRSCRLVGAPKATRRLIMAACLGEGLVLDGPLPRRSSLPVERNVACELAAQPAEGWAATRLPVGSGAPSRPDRPAGR